MTDWTGFYQKNRGQRLEVIKDSQLLSDSSALALEKNHQLPLEVADQMVENVIGTLSLPLALVPGVVVNGRTYQVPYVTEEPSVVAAASKAAKIIGQAGGFEASVQERLMIGQIALYEVPNKLTASQTILEQTDQILALANAAHPSIVKRGGGARGLRVEVVEDFLIVYLTVDTQEAMGANMVNTMCEAIAPFLEDLSGGKRLMAILSNYATESLVTATCQIPLSQLDSNQEQARELADKMVLASQLAQADPYRASTHNKGIFNGIDALLIATGNDWRAIEAGAHAYASRDGRYRGLTNWSLSNDGQTLLGQITLPLPVATKGGSIGLNPSVQVAHDLLGNPTAKELATIVAAMGLGQNFAAIRALTSTGIQAGHMKLQAKSLALLAGAQPEQVDALVAQLLQEKHLNLETAKTILDRLNER